MTNIPDRLRRRLHWTRVPLPPEAKPTILLLYAGKDDAGSLDSYLHATCPDLSPLVWAIDIRRDKGPLGQDMLQASLWNHLCSLAVAGLLLFVGGGPNCRTWSMLRWSPKPNAPRPVRGRSEQQVRGLPANTAEEQLYTDNDSMLVLRQMYLTSLAYQGLAQCHPPRMGYSFLEHPTDPMEVSASPRHTSAHPCG